MLKGILSERLTLVTETVPVVDRSGASVAEVESVVGLRRGNKTAWQAGVDRSTDGSLGERSIRVSRRMGARVFEWYKNVHANPNSGTLYDCFTFVQACLVGVIPDAHRRVAVRGDYGFSSPCSATGLRAGKGYVVLPRDSDKPSHGVVAVDNQNVLHVTSVRGKMVYSTAMAALAMYPGDLQDVRKMHAETYKAVPDHEWVRPMSAT